MAKFCRVCGKSTTHGGQTRHKTTSNISRHGAWGHRATRTTRAWKPSLRKAEIMDGDKVVTDWVCMKCYKKASA